METGDVIFYSRNSFHDLPETYAQTLDYHRNIPMDEAASEVDNTMVREEKAPVEQLQLRDYQLELAEHAVLGRNSIVVAPTGSGKTHVALHIAKCHLEAADLEDDRKVVFLVPTVSLVNQQKEMFSRYFSPTYKTVGVSGDSPQLALSGLVPTYDIFVVTPQILVDAIKKDVTPIDISVFTLLIFDECHHTDKGHPYNKVMADYLDKKLEGNRNLPQVVGLTASVGVGKAKDLEGAMTHLLKLCANMDAQKLSTVQKNRQQLLKFTHKAREGNPYEVPRRTHDPFKTEICQLMQLIEQKLATAPALPNALHMTGLAKLLVAPSDRGSEQYTQWVNKLTTPVIEVRDPEIRRLIMTCIEHLKMYNEALYINADCQIQDALEFVLKTVEKINLELADDTERWLNQIFRERKAALEAMKDDPNLSNPKLDTIRQILLRYYQNDHDSRGIIFCRTRATTVALERWMKETPDLRPLKPKRLVAANAPTDKGGMVQSEQDEALRLFRDGHHKIIIATSVAEEGLDVQACNFVMRYEHVTNETARIQARGRARKPGAEYMLVTELGCGAAQRDEINRMREDLMNDAIRRIDRMDMADFTRQVRKHQHDAKLARQLAMMGEQRKLTQRNRRRPEVLHRLLCSRCSTFVCISLDIRRVEKVHHVVIDEHLKTVASMRKYPKAAKYGDFDQRGKLNCSKCDKEWGVVAHYSNVLFPVLKLTNFVLEDDNGQRKCYKKWKDVPFHVEELSADDIQRLNEEDIELVQW